MAAIARPLLLLAAAAVACQPFANAQAPPAASAARFAVVLDAAHGGDDQGARLANQSEKDYTLALSVKLRSLLVARGISVVTTRESGADVDADRRAEIANRANAAACMNLHAAYVSSKSGPAVHLFISSLPAAADARFVPWKTAQSAWITRSTELAGLLNAALTHAGITVTLGRTALPAIDSMACPAVAIEVAPQRQTVAQDAAGADDAGFEAQVAEALAAALVEWRAEGGQSGESRP
ncbi:MAG: N-acetylmuramoyl-L-alanine amidase [Terracidiphilus sp.]|nr:N-acetylmuramoyl-L-alanine amidase [Terracidiphilus sp.]MDR3797522.1 N-acetylmuramoyl-L-alanine amidase [Terracidiphilus sp.]